MSLSGTNKKKQPRKPSRRKGTKAANETRIDPAHELASAQSSAVARPVAESPAAESPVQAAISQSGELKADQVVATASTGTTEPATPAAAVTTTASGPSETPRLSTKHATETRIDAAHPTTALESAERGNAAEEATRATCEPSFHEELGLAGPAVAPAADPEMISAQVHLQAAQLGEHLRTRQTQLDHREAELNARAAQLERDARAARLWLNERMAELDDQAKTSTPAAESQDASATSSRRAADALASREQRVSADEARLEIQRVEMQTLYNQLIEDRRFLDEKSCCEQERLAAERRAVLAELEEKRRTLEQRTEHVDQSQASLEQLRGELGRMHRETLEIRLATEELWAELSAAAPPAALTRSLGRIRTRLADQYRMANAEIQQKKEELERLRSQLAERYEKLVRQKRQFDEWAAACREEVEQQSSRLLERGRELDRREADTHEQSRQWQAERLELQQEIRRLQTKISSLAEAGLPV
jgi:hypothetical protein